MIKLRSYGHCPQIILRYAAEGNSRAAYWRSNYICDASTKWLARIIDEGHPVQDGLHLLPDYQPVATYRLTASGGLQLGKNVLDTIFDVCPLVALLLGRK
jgi:hypothetical protein